MILNLLDAALTIQRVMINVNKFIINPLIISGFAIALLLFMWGVVRYLFGKSQGKSDPAGGQHMLWGVIGMFIMAAALGIVQVITNTIAKFQ